MEEMKDGIVLGRISIEKVMDSEGNVNLAWHVCDDINATEVIGMLERVKIEYLFSGVQNDAS